MVLVSKKFCIEGYGNYCLHLARESAEMILDMQAGGFTMFYIYTFLSRNFPLDNPPHPCYLITSLDISILDMLTSDISSRDRKERAN